MDPILANILTAVGLQVATALGRRVDGATAPDSPVAAAIAKVGVQTVDAEVIPALEAWSQSSEFERCLTALTTGEDEFSAESLVDSFIQSGDFYGGAQTKQLALETLRSFGGALEEALMGGEAGVAIHDRHDRRRFKGVHDDIHLVREDLSDIRSLLEGQSSPPVGGWWQRFDAYEFEEGWIKPRADAVMSSYDPWEEHRREGPEIYKSLCALSERMRQSSNITHTPKGRFAYELPDDVGRDVLDWCAHYGLPGTLLLRVESVVLPARWSAGGGLSEHMWGKPAPCHPSITTFWRVNGGWSAGGHTYPFTEDETELEHRRQVVPGTVILPEERHGSWPAPGVAIRQLSDGELCFEELGKTWARFFPNVPDEERDTYDYPPPLSEEFWHQYGERVEDFMNAAFHLATALEWVEGGRKNPLDELDHEGKPTRLWCFNTGATWLQGLIRPVSPVLNRLKDGRFESLWASPSLLSSLAMMAFLDLTRA